MKRHWVTIVMALVLAGLAGYVYFIELPTERANTEKATAEKKLLPLERQDITGLTVQAFSEEIVLVPGQDGTWKMTAPLQAEADAREVDALLRALLLGKVTRVVDEEANALEPFGLAKPSVTVTITAGSRKERIAIGDIGPISSTLYVMRDSDKKVLLTDLAAKDFLNKRLYAFRKKEVLPFDEAKAERLRLTYPNREIVLYRTGEVDKLKRNKWVLRAPREAPADTTEARMLLARIQEVKALGFIDAGKEREAVAKTLKKPQLRLTVYVAGTEQTASFYQPDPSSGEAYAVTTEQAPIYRISPSVIKDLTKEPFALQDKRLLGAEYDDIAMLTVKTQSEQYTLINQTGTWVFEGKPEEKLDQQKVDLFVSRVASLPAELLVAKEGGPPAKYGLATPAAELTATGKDGKTRRRLALGTKTGGLLYAVGSGLPGVYQVRADILSQIPPPKDLLMKSETTGTTPQS
jgi:hypothetical protein